MELISRLQSGLVHFFHNRLSKQSIIQQMTDLGALNFKTLIPARGDCDVARVESNFAAISM